MDYDGDTSEEFTTQLGVLPKANVLVFDFGARGGARDRWAEKLKASCKSLSIFRIGGDVMAASPEETLQSIKKIFRSDGIQVNASGMRSRALEVLGQKRYFEEFLESWNKCKGDGVKGLSLLWGNGMGDLANGWDILARGEVGPEQGLVFDLGKGNSIPSRM